MLPTTVMVSEAITRRRGPTKGDQREQAILRVASELFSAKPISQITIDELSAGAGISRSSFYFYFPSKHAVLAALVESLAADLTVGHNAWLDGTGRNDAAMREAAKYLAVMWRNHGALIEQARAAGGEYQPVLDFLEFGADRFAARLGAKITRDREAGAAPNGVPAETLARMVDAARSARFRALIGRKDSRSDARAVDDVVAVTNSMLYGIVPAE
jgi:AcrR family transcriptional regulator